MREEWELAIRLVNHILPKRPHLRGNFTFDVVCWKDEHAPLTMEAGKSAQSVVDERILPSECDVVVVMLWSRLGTPMSDRLKADGESYASGTEWEFEEAMAAQPSSGVPAVWVFKRTEPIALDPSAPDFDQCVAQAKAVQDFADRIAKSKGINLYKTPAEFVERLQYALEEHVQRLKPRDEPEPEPPVEVHLETRIQNFLEDYLTREDQACPVPFGGRDAEFDRLDRWLDDRNGPARCLVSAPAGRGKSALLVRWVERLRQSGRVATADHPDDHRWRVVFVPISIRFQTNLPEHYHRAMAERLASVANVRLTAPALEPADYYGDRVSELMRKLSESGTRVLIIIDGVDEALRGEFNGDLLPKRLSWNIRVLVSARWLLGDTDIKGWLRRLDWEARNVCQPFALSPLDTSAIASVLVNMGSPVDHLAKYSDLVERLAQLTEGEPLLLRYYAEDLWGLTGKAVTNGVSAQTAARITRDDLDSLKPGFGAYFDRWLKHQQAAWKAAGERIDRDAVDSVLTILAFAHGPLECDDLVAMLQHCSRPLAVVSVERLLEPLHRFVIGTGRPGEGYVLAHPRIGSYFQESRFHSARGLMHQAFVSWGRKVICEVNAKPESAAPAATYLLQFHRLHLQAVDAPLADFMNMVEDGWRRSWERYERSQWGFSTDVLVALRRARRHGPLAEVAAQLRCILTLSSICSLNYDLPRVLLLRAVDQQALTIGQATHLAQFMHNRSDYVATLRDLAVWFECGADVRARLLSEALAACDEIVDVRERAEALVELAQHLKLEQLRRAMTCADTIDDDLTRAEAFSGLAPYLDASLLTAMLGAVRAIRNDSARTKALISLYPYLQGAQLREALSIAHTIDHQLSRVQALVSLAPRLSRAQRARALSTALAYVGTIGSERARAEALRDLVPHLEHPQQREVLSLASVIGDQYWRTVALSWVAPHLPPAQRIEALRRVAPHLKNSLGELGKLDRISVPALTLGSPPEDRSPEFASPGDSQEAFYEAGPNTSDVRAVLQALVEARAIRDGYWQVGLLAALAERTAPDARASICHESLAIADGIVDDVQRAEALVRLAPWLSPEQLGTALDKARSIEDEHARALALSGLGAHMTPAMRSQTLAIARTMVDERHCQTLLVGLAPHLDEHELDDALSIAERFAYERARVDALVGLAPHIERQQLGGVLSRIMLAPSAVFRAAAFTRLAWHLEPVDRVIAHTEALSAASLIESDTEKAQALEALSQHLSSEQLQEALKVAERIHDTFSGQWAVRRLKSQLQVALDCEARGITRTSAAHELHGQLPALMHLDADEQVAAWLADAMTLRDENDRARSLIALGPHLAKTQQAVALEAIARISNVSSRALALGGLAPYLEGELRSSALLALLELGDAITRADLLVALQPFLGLINELGGSGAMVALRRALHDTCSWYQ